MRTVALYRQILKLHRLVLPPDLRFVGDAYVRDEFRKHQKADASFLKYFYQAWEDYASNLESQRASGYIRGVDLSKEAIESMSESQRQQLSLLRREATRRIKQEQEHNHAHGHVHGPHCKH